MTLSQSTKIIGIGAQHFLLKNIILNRESHPNLTSISLTAYRGTNCLTIKIFNIMKEKINVSKEMEYFDGLYFDTECYNVKKPDAKQVVRFIFFNDGDTLQRAMLSNNPLFNGRDDTTRIIPDNLRFSTLFKYAGLISPYGYRNNRIDDMVDLMNNVFGSWRFDFIEGQISVLNVPKLKSSKGVFVANNYSSSQMYTGQHGYHHSHNEIINNPRKAFRYRIGVELEIEANGREELETIRKYKSNWFFMERDGSLNDYGVEFVTIPLLPKDAKSSRFWTPLCVELQRKAVSWDSSNCGLHVHIGREILGRTEKVRSETLGKLLYLYHHFVKNTPFNATIYGRDRAYHDIECKSGIARAVDILGKKVLKNRKFRSEIDKELKDKSYSERYFDINILNSNTIEFRRGKGSLNATRIGAVVEYCEHLCLYAKRVKWEDISLDNFIKYLHTNVKEKTALFHLMHSKKLI